MIETIMIGAGILFVASVLMAFQTKRETLGLCLMAVGILILAVMYGLAVRNLVAAL